MRRQPWLIVLIVEAGLVVGLGYLVVSRRMPLGVPGEWEWSRVRVGPDLLPLLAGLGAIGVYAGFVAMGARSIHRGGRPLKWLAGLIPVAMLLQATVQEASPDGYGLAKWAIALHSPGSSGYYTVAKSQIVDLRRFLKDYPQWINEQDALHVGTHPPGLFVVAWGMLRAMESNPGLARSVTMMFPRSVNLGFRTLSELRPIPIADRAALAMTGFAIMAACSATVVPLYLLARSWVGPGGSWASAALWPLIPSAILFQPTADTAFPLLATTALALAAWTPRRRMLAVMSGAVLGLGTQFTLALFPVGLVVAILHLTARDTPWQRRLISIGLTGLGFLAITLILWAAMGANPFAIWRINATNHARFYVEFPRSYWAWVAENPAELAIAIGLPTTVCAACGFRSIPRATWATVAVLALLTVTGKNLSEVARLWLPMMPALLVAAGAGIDRLGPRPAGIAATVALLGVQTLLLESAIQVVYPV